VKLLALIGLLLLASPAWASSDAPAASTPAATAQAHSKGQIDSAADVADPIFGVHSRVLGLERGVEMLQWRKVDFPAPPHYEQAWTAERIDSTGFDSAHRNPGDLPFNGQRWWTVKPVLDGHPVSADVLAKLDSWTPLKPDLAQLPTNLAVSFQPDGDWLSTSQDPVHPQIGDVRVRWRAIAPSPAPGGAVLVAGRWELPVPTKTVGTVPAAASRFAKVPGTGSSRDPLEVPRRMVGDHLIWLVAAGIALVLLVLVLARKRKPKSKPKSKRR
jgi:LPXTG-motif cell wall-anchored protein